MVRHSKQVKRNELLATLQVNNDNQESLEGNDHHEAACVEAGEDRNGAIKDLRSIFSENFFEFRSDSRPNHEHANRSQKNFLRPDATLLCCHRNGTSIQG